MDIEIQLARAPITEPVSLPPDNGLGAWVEFRGVVRGEEDGQAIAALEYEAYSPMAEQEMRTILEHVAERHPCLAARVIHRVGVVPVGEVAIYVGIAGRHRGEAFALLGEFMERLKQDVPIWKCRAIAKPNADSNGGPVAPAVIHRAPHRPQSVHSAAEVLTLLRELCQPLETERVPLGEAAGRVLRESVGADADQPPFDRSSVDGYAVRRDDPATAFHIVDAIRAGDWKPRQLQPGETVRIATGGALPGKDLQVVMKEDVRVEGDRLTTMGRDAESNIRFRGEDAQKGAVLVEAGTVLSPGALALLASVGGARPLVTRLPRVRHIATGNEIVSPDQTPERGQIRDSNSTLVRAFFGQWGIVPEQRRVGEDEVAVASEIRNPKSEIEPPDLLLISGGASVGEHDFTRRVLEESGFTIYVHRTTARPGKPLIVAQRGGTLAFGLPGNPLAHFVCLNLYARVALGSWAGQGGQAVFQSGVLAMDLAAGGNARETFWPARWTLMEGTASLTPLRWSSSGDLTSLTTANALIRIPAGAQQLKRGRLVEFTAC